MEELHQEADHFLEEYWKLFKDFIKKLYDEFPVVQSFIDLEMMVNNLNHLKSQKQYIEIEKYIEQYVVQVGWIMIKYYQPYYFNIYYSQLKRWRHVPSFKNDLTEKERLKYLKHLNDNSFILYLTLLNNVSDSINEPIYKTLFTQLHVPNYEDEQDMKKCHQYNISKITEIIPKIVEDGKAGTLTVLSNHLDLSENMMNLYGIKIRPNMDGRKILNLIKRTDNIKK